MEPLGFTTTTEPPSHTIWERPRTKTELSVLCRYAHTPVESSLLAFGRTLLLVYCAVKVLTVSGAMAYQAIVIASCVSSGRLFSCCALLEALHVTAQ